MMSIGKAKEWPRQLKTDLIDAANKAFAKHSQNTLLIAGIARP